MRTRAQVNAWREVTAKHRRDTVAFTAAIAASRREHEAAQQPRASAASNEPSPARQNGVQASGGHGAFVTPEKATRKRKLSGCSPSKAAYAAARGATPGVSPATRSSKRRQAAAPATKTKSTVIRRALDYAGATSQPLAKADDEADDEPDEAAVDASPRGILERVASGIPTTAALVGRAEERQQIEGVFASEPTTRAVFVIGPPGTGKSSCVAHVAARHSGAATVVRVNCSTFASPAALFSAIGEQLRAHSLAALPPLEHAQLLEDFLQTALHASTHAPPCVLVLDEVDHLVRLPAAMALRAQSVLRFLVRWALLPNSSLRFIGILNGIDMHAQIAEFLAHDPHPTSVVLFPSYSLPELLKILHTYVQSATPGCLTSHVGDVIEPRALELIARKIAARDGDARRAVGLLQQCARACLASHGDGHGDAATTTPGPLSIRVVLQCSNAALSSQLSEVKQIQQLPRQPKLLLYAITRLAPCETSTTTVADACEELQMLQTTRPELAWIPRFRHEEIQQHLGSLDCYALVKQTAAKNAHKARLSSSVSMDTLARAFQSDELLNTLPTGTTTPHAARS